MQDFCWIRAKASSESLYTDHLNTKKAVLISPAFCVNIMQSGRAVETRSIRYVL